MAEELKNRQWDKLKPQRRKHLLRYPWHDWLNGSTWLLLQGEDFDIPPVEFQAYVLHLARENNARVKTMINEEGTGVYIKKTNAHTDRFLRIQKEWRQRWENQKKLGIDEWWKYPERLDDLRERRAVRRATKEQPAPPRPKKHEGPYIPGWQRKLMERGEWTDVEDEA